MKRRGRSSRKRKAHTPGGGACDVRDRNGSTVSARILNTEGLRDEDGVQHETGRVACLGSGASRQADMRRSLGTPVVARTRIKPEARPGARS
ncbi:hypothetical protein Afil01_47830 [Actinorhabdospora filicis]|uniref:Uncharacterized protein n=1 Tax=Actinorhabdospora filicis TaxID=1785913 RepID=A0A9W6SSK3_9ACTN|nr:hypothetical protein Afil01_47830 [Actinorhabdospora filicis]